MKQNIITLREAARRSGVSPSTIYHYIKSGVLPPPEHRPNEKAGRGILAVYPESIVNSILQIKYQLQDIHSLSMVDRNIGMPEETRKNIIIRKLEQLLNFAKKGLIKDEKFKRELRNVEGMIGASLVTANLYTGESEGKTPVYEIKKRV